MVFLFFYEYGSYEILKAMSFQTFILRNTSIRASYIYPYTTGHSSQIEITQFSVEEISLPAVPPTSLLAF